jgi:phycocyanobilin lyase beta subunit
LEFSENAEQDQLERCFKGLLKAVRDDEWVVRYAAAYGLEQRLNSAAVVSHLGAQGRAALNQLASDAEGVRVVQLRALKALQRLNAG